MTPEELMIIYKGAKKYGHMIEPVYLQCALVFMAQANDIIEELEKKLDTRSIV